MNKQKLKNCPFCGGVTTSDYEGEDHGYEHGGGCDTLTLSGVHDDDCPFSQTVENGVAYDMEHTSHLNILKEWNTRPEEDRLNARIKELEEGLQHIINHVEMVMQGDNEAFKMHAHWYTATKTLNKGNKND